MKIAIDHTTRYVYDDQDRLAYRISADGRVSSYSYDIFGNVTKTADFSADFYPAGTTAVLMSDVATWLAGLAHRDQVEQSRSTYDARGNLLQKVNFARALAGGGTDMDGGYRRTNYIYDQAGQLLKRTVKGENAEQFIYDGLGRMTASTDV